MTLLQDALYGRILEDPDDPLLHLTLAAAGARTPQALWQEVADVLSVMYGCTVQIDFADRMTVGSVTAGDLRSGGGTPLVFEFGEGHDDRVNLTLVPGTAPVPGGKVDAILTAAMSLADLVTRRALLDLERRRGAFLVELSSWMLEASADPRSLVKYTLQSAMDLVGGHAALVAVTTADGGLQVLSAVGEIEEQQTTALQLVEAAIGQALSNQSPVLLPRIENGCREVPDDLRGRFAPAMLVPTGDNGQPRGVVCVLRVADGFHRNKPFTQDDVGNLETVASRIFACVELIEAVEAAGRAAHRASLMLEECDVPLARVAPTTTLTRANKAFSNLLGFEDKHDLVGRDANSLPMVIKDGKLSNVLDQARSGLPWQGRIHLLRGDDLRRCVGVATRLIEADPEELLLAIRDKTEEFLGHATQDEESDGTVGDVMEAVDRAAKIAKEVLALSPPATDLMERVNIDDLVRNVIEIRSRVFHTEPTVIRADLGSHKSLVLTLPEDLQQLFVNLIRNAEQAVSGRSDGRILIETTLVNGRVHARVSDSGPGVDPDLRTRIFDPFFTTKDRDSASGLGLAVSKRIVSALKGKIWVEDAELGGASFVVELPTTAPLV